MPKQQTSEIVRYHRRLLRLIYGRRYRRNTPITRKSRYIAEDMLDMRRGF
ncbi:MAG: hypothetical protein ACK5FO_01780 [Burkholderiales bacterium]